MATAMNSIFKAFANIVRLLPTGTVFVFLFFSPLVTNEGSCQTLNKWLTGSLIAICALFCVVSCFTDSYRDGSTTRYGIVTTAGRLWPYPGVTVSRLGFNDIVHVFLSLIVLGVLVLLDPNTMKCLYSSFKTDWLVEGLPFVIGILSGVSSMYPYRRHGLGYHYNSSEANPDGYDLLPSSTSD